MNSIMDQTEAKILAVVEEHRHILLEPLLARLPELTWNQVFTIVDSLSRRGLLCLWRRGFEYELLALSTTAPRQVHASDYALSRSS